MGYVQEILDFATSNNQEEQDKKVILDYIRCFPDNILLRENEFAHITSSGFILNETLDRVLLVHHNIRNTWSWTGGHADGDVDLLKVAIKEAVEETGIGSFRPLSEKIASIDILPVFGHMRKGRYVSTHLHLSIAYLLVAGDQEKLTVKADENSGVCWFGTDRFNREHFDEHDLYLYGKLIQRARRILPA